MLADFFAPAPDLWTGALAGLIFGFLLQKGGITRFETIVGQFLLKDFTVLKVMMTAIVVGGIGIYGMQAAGMEVALHVKGAHVLANVSGGLLFGVGMAVLGYCPGTGLAAIGDGSRHAVVGVAGMLCGAWLYALASPWMKSTVQPVGDLGKETFVSLSGSSPWVFLLPLAGVATVGLFVLERFEHRRDRTT